MRTLCVQVAAAASGRPQKSAGGGLVAPHLGDERIDSVEAAFLAQAGALANEFQRTVSRIREMQSVDYLRAGRRAARATHLEVFPDDADRFEVGVAISPRRHLLPLARRPTAIYAGQGQTYQW